MDKMENGFFFLETVSRDCFFLISRSDVFPFKSGIEMPGGECRSGREDSVTTTTTTTMTTIKTITDRLIYTHIHTKKNYSGFDGQTIIIGQIGVAS